MKKLKFLLLSAPLTIFCLGIFSFLKPARPLVFRIFEGTSPCNTGASSFLQIPTNSRCDEVKWKLTFYTDEASNPTTFKLDREYGYYPDNFSTTSMGKVSIEGRWKIQKGTKWNLVYQLQYDNQSISFQLMDDNLLHLLNADNTLAIGNDGHSFTLNRTQGIIKQQINYSPTKQATKSLPTGFKVDSIRFVGKTPCKELAGTLKISNTIDCFKLKWDLILVNDPEKNYPTTYELRRTGHRESVIKGTWIVSKGTKTNPEAIVYQLDPDKPNESLLLLKGDDNVLFFLDKNRNFLVGNSEFSYTLNRLRK